jgi:hypothetical protein
LKIVSATACVTPASSISSRRRALLDGSGSCIHRIAAQITRAPMRPRSTRSPSNSTLAADSVARPRASQMWRRSQPAPVKSHAECPSCGCGPGRFDSGLVVKLADRLGQRLARPRGVAGAGLARRQRERAAVVGGEHRAELDHAVPLRAPGSDAARLKARNSPCNYTAGRAAPPSSLCQRPLGAPVAQTAPNRLRGLNQSGVKASAAQTPRTESFRVEHRGTQPQGATCHARPCADEPGRSAPSS